MLYRIPFFPRRKSSHIFTVWQHMVLLMIIRQYEGKSYRLFSEWLVEEAYYLRTFLQLSHIPHFTSLQKFIERISGTLLEKVVSSSFTILTKIGQPLFIGIDSSGFKTTHASQVLCRKSKAEEKKKIH